MNQYKNVNSSNNEKTIMETDNIVYNDVVYILLYTRNIYRYP